MAARRFHGKRALKAGQSDQFEVKKMSPLDDLTREERKAIVKEAITEWMDGKFLELGIWTFRGVLALGFGVLVYFVMTMNGWVRHN